MGRRAISQERQVELLEWLEDLRYARGRVYQFRMFVNHDELPAPSQTALRVSRIERELTRLLIDCEAAWDDQGASKAPE